jgi:hypothetical protein
MIRNKLRDLDEVLRFGFMSESESLKTKREQALTALAERWILHPINRKTRKLTNA